MLAHELRRRMAAMRVIGEAITSYAARDSTLPPCLTCSSTRSTTSTTWPERCWVIGTTAQTTPAQY
jgi:hypothetical protein